MNAPARSKRQKIDGVLLLDKPLGMTSNAALQKAKWLLNAAKAGHTGTLDPLATGLLPLCFGEATKFSQVLLDADKVYEATICLGVTTTTADAEGDVVAERPVDCNFDAVRAAAARFVGDIEQVPPRHSALKLDGRPYYEYARAGIEIERKPRVVTVHAIDVVEFSSPILKIVVSCSKGTYIRVLAEDIGEVLGCGAHLQALRRTGTGGFSIADAVTLQALEAIPAADRVGVLAPVDAPVASWPRIDLGAEAANGFAHGQAVFSSGTDCEGIRVFGPGERFLGIAKREAGSLMPKRLLNHAGGDDR